MATDRLGHDLQSYSPIAKVADTQHAGLKPRLSFTQIPPRGPKVFEISEEFVAVKALLAHGPRARIARSTANGAHMDLLQLARGFHCRCWKPLRKLVRDPIEVGQSHPV